ISLYGHLANQPTLRVAAIALRRRGSRKTAPCFSLHVNSQLAHGHRPRALQDGGAGMISTMQNTPAVRFLRLPEVKLITGLRKTAIYERIKNGTFPTSIPLGGRAVGWIESEIIKWVADRVADARPTLGLQVQATAAWSTFQHYPLPASCPSNPPIHASLCGL